MHGQRGPRLLVCREGAAGTSTCKRGKCQGGVGGCCWPLLKACEFHPGVREAGWESYEGEWAFELGLCSCVRDCWAEMDKVVGEGNHSFHSEGNVYTEKQSLSQQLWVPQLTPVHAEGSQLWVSGVSHGGQAAARRSTSARVKPKRSAVPCHSLEFVYSIRSEGRRKNRRLTQCHRSPPAGCADRKATSRLAWRGLSGSPLTHRKQQK